MDSYPRSILGSQQNCTPPCLISALDAPFKLDEGYSEETRSQYDGDSSMGLEPRSGNVMPLSLSSLTVLPDVVMSLSEAERSGTVIFLA